jgi:D-arginine dehydrogenase
MLDCDWSSDVCSSDLAWTARVGTDQVRARVIVCAAGAWADQVAKSCNVAPVGLVPMRRTALLITPPDDWEIENWPLVMTASESVYFRPDAGKLMVSPADETPDEPGDVQPDEWDVAVAAHRLQELLDIEVRRVDASWAGLRTFAPDRAPVVGFDPDSPRFFWFAGQGGYGFQLAPALAEAGAAMLAGQRLPDDVDWRSIAANRFCNVHQS